jgi:hypothetical protein
MNKDDDNSKKKAWNLSECNKYYPKVAQSEYTVKGKHFSY